MEMSPEQCLINRCLNELLDLECGEQSLDETVQGILLAANNYYPFVEAMRAELLSLMPEQSESEWTTQPVVCRWCGCWLEYGDVKPFSDERPEELHKSDCFAVKYLGRPGGA